jgi:hypothetical protein
MLRTLLFILTPIRHVRTVVSWWGVAQLVGFPAVSVALGWVGPYLSPLDGLLLAFAGLSFWAAHRLFLEAGMAPVRLEIQPHLDDRFARLMVTNPNGSVAQGVTITVTEHLLDGQALGAHGLSPGFRFPWSTHGRDSASVSTSIPARASDYVDVAFVPHDYAGLAYFAAVSDGRKVDGTKPFIARARMHLVVEAAALQPALPPGRWLVELELLSNQQWWLTTSPST